MRLTKRSRHCKIVLIGGLALVALSATGLFIFRPSPKPSSSTSKSANSTSSTKAAEVPAESSIKPDEYKWTGAPDEPRYISLPTIQGGGFIQKVGLNASNQIAAPSNVHIAGWYNNSKKPGETGLSIIDGHVDGYTQAGIFEQLKRLQTGDEFTVEMGSGVKLHYSVMYVTAVDTKDALSVLFSQNTNTKSQLNLITCGGNYNKDSQHYEKRVIVAANLLS